MIEFSILDSDNTVLLGLNSGSDINDKTLTLDAEEFSFENKIVENSFLAGSVKLGETRIQARQATLTLSRFATTDAEYKTMVNTLLKALKQGTYLCNVTDDTRIPYALDSVSIAYLSGSLKRASEDVITLTFLNPYWEDVDETEHTSISVPATTLTEEAFNNNGYIELQGRFEITAEAAVDELTLSVVETYDSITVNDSLFGTTGYEELIIDCKEGTVEIGELDRIASIANGTGFFSIPAGESTLRFYASGAVTVALFYRERYYV